MVVLPTYNERENVAALLAAVRAALAGRRRPGRRRQQPGRHGDPRRGDGRRARADQAAAPARQAGPRQRLPAGVRRRPRRGLRRRSCRWTSTSPTTRPSLPELLALLDAGADAVIGSAGTCRAAPPSTGRCTAACSPLGQPLHVARAGAAGPRLHVRLPRLPRRGAAGDRAVHDDGRGLRLPHRAGPAARAPRLPGDGDADRVHRSAVRAVEDVRPDRRRVDAAGHAVGRCATS